MRLRLQGGHLVPCATVEVTSSGRRAGAAPLLEEERDARGEALVADASDPIGVHGARPGSALAADDDPVQSVGAKREVAEIGEERLAGDETDVAGRGSEVGEAHEVGRGFDTDGDTETAWKVCEPTSIQHEGPSRRLVEMATRVAALRGSPIACFGSADLVRRDAAGRKRWLMQADEVLYLHPERVRLQGPAIDVDADPLPDVVLEVDHTTDVRRGEAYREEAESRAFPGWKAEEIHHALTEEPLSAGARRALERTALAMGARAGTRPEDDPFTRTISRMAEAKGHAQGHREGRLSAHRLPLSHDAAFGPMLLVPYLSPCHEEGLVVGVLHPVHVRHVLHLDRQPLLPHPPAGPQEHELPLRKNSFCGSIKYNSWRRCAATLDQEAT